MTQATCSLRINYDENKKPTRVAILDLTDPYNEPTMYSTGKRGIAKLVQQIKTMEWELLTRKQWMQLFDEYKVKFNTYCAMD